MSNGVDARLRALYDAERACGTDVPEGTAERVLEGVNAKLATGAVLGTGAAPSTVMIAAGGLAAAAAVALGIGVFLRLDGASAPEPEQVTGHLAVDAAVDPKDAAQATAPPVRADATDPHELSVPPYPRSPENPRRAVPASAEQEWTLIQHARVALRSGRTDEALDLLEAHAEHHPLGALTEERERLAIEALMASGRTADARRRAREFGRRYPFSLHQAEIERLLAP